MSDSGVSAEEVTEVKEWVPKEKLISTPRSNSKELSTRKTASTTTTRTTSTTTKIHFIVKLTTGNGRWRQVKTVGLDEFLKAEGGNWIYRTAASSAIPDFIYTKQGKK